MDFINKKHLLSKCANVLCAMKMHVHGFLLFCIIIFTGLDGALSTGSNNKVNEYTMPWSNVSMLGNVENLKTHKDVKTEKKNSTIWFNTSVLQDLARSVSLTSLDTIHKIAYKVLLTYNRLLNINSKRAQAISAHLQTTGAKLEELEHDLDDLVEDLHEKYETSDSDKKQAVKVLLDIALEQREQLNRKKASEYNVLECGTVMGNNCATDEDCYGKGCLLQCKTSGYLWWRDSVCR